MPTELGTGQATATCTNPPQRLWFGLQDCLIRWALPFVTYYFFVLTHPISFPKYALAYNKVWYNTHPVLGWALTLSYPVMPLVLMLVEVFNAVKRALSPPPQDLAAKVWFSVPTNPIAAVLWQSGLNIARMVALFMVSGPDQVAIDHVIDEHLTTKDFWRTIMTRGGCRTARELGRWEGDRLILDHDVRKYDVVVKLQDAFFSIGDQFLTNGKEFTDAESLQRFMEEATYLDYQKQPTSYKGKKALILEFCRPPARLGVHGLDILTVATHDGVKVVNCLYWAECTGSSSHSTTAGYCVDIEKEEVVAPCRWYSPYFATASDKLVGLKLPGVKKACEQALAAHSQTPFPWMTTVGWDGMFLRSGEVVFFEGNFGSIRIPRRIFLTVSNWWQFFSMYSWPFSLRRPTFEPFVASDQKQVSEHSTSLRQRTVSSWGASEDSEEDRLAG